MKTINVRELQARVKRTVNLTQEDRVVITRRGMPAAVLIGVEGKDWEDVLLEAIPQFWRLIDQRRRQKTISTDDMRRRLKIK